MKTIAYCTSNVIRYYISIVIRQKVEYKFLIKNVCVYMCNEKITQVVSTLSKVLEQLQIPSFIMGK